MLPCTVMKSNSYAKGWLLTNAADNKEEEETPANTTSAHALSDSDIVSKIFVVVHWRLSNHDHGHNTAASRR